MGNGMEKVSEVMEKFYVLILVVDTWAYALLKTHITELNICKLFLKLKVNKMFKNSVETKHYC